MWQHAQLEVGFSGPYRDHLAVGAHATLWDGFLMRWVSWLRDNIPDIAISASASLSAVMIQRLLEGTLDLAVMYRPGQPPGLTIEHLFDEEFVLVTSAPARSRRTESNYVFVDWGPISRPSMPPPIRAVDQHGGQSGSAARWGLDFLLANREVITATSAPRLVRSATSTGVACASRRGRALSVRRYARGLPEARGREGLRADPAGACGAPPAR